MAEPEELIPPPAPGSEQENSYQDAGLSGVIDRLPDAVVIADGTGRILYANRRMETLLGWDPAGLVGEPVTVLIPPRLRDAHQRGFDALVAGGEPRLVGRTVRVAALTSIGDEVPIELVVSLVRDEHGPIRLLASMRDAGDKVDLERQTHVVDGLLAALADGADDLPRRFLAVIAEGLDCDVAALWAVEEGTVLRARQIWQRSAADIAEFRFETESACFDKGQGLPGRVLADGKPAWIADLDLDDSFARARSASMAGLTTAFAFPVGTNRRWSGVIELYSRQPRQPDPGLMAAMESVGQRLGELMDRAEAERDRQQLQTEQQRLLRTQTFLLESARALSQASAYTDALDRLSKVAVPALADLCLIDVLSEGGSSTLERVMCRHADPAHQDLADQLLPFAPTVDSDHPSIAVIRTRRPRVSSYVSDAYLTATTHDERHLALVRRLQFTSYMCVPLLAEGEVLGTMTLVSGESRRRFGSEDLAIAEQLASHAAAVIARTRHHDRDREAVRQLQGAFLPHDLAPVEQLELAAAYLPASEAPVGGDWYDAFPLDRGTCIVVGDVAGHGLHSVAVMAQLRNAVRAYACEDPSPSRILGRLNRMLCRLEPDETATVVLATWVPAEGILRWGRAGHPPILRCRPGEFGFLDSELSDPLLGCVPEASYHEASKVLRPGTTLVLYTDGLIEARGTPLEAAMVDLQAFAAGLTDLKPSVVRDALLDWRLGRGEVEDDVCLVAVRLA